MAGKQKFGAFAGVFTPSILTILGVIMYMRLGWVVGNAGLIGTIIIILIAHVIAVTTGLSVSSIATDKKIGAGGIYYVLSRSMGVPIGGAIGIALYVGTAFSIALYLIGFAESFNGYFDLGMTVNAFRITGTVALILLTTLALISTSAALKAQFFILAAIIISLIAIFFGTSEYVPTVVQMFSTDNSVPLETVFAIFFPAVTGFTAGIAMSGDLKDPKKSIPVGTLFAIGVGLVVYIGLAIFISYTVNSEVLRTDYNILMKIALFAPAVVAGIWGATLSSALGGILGGPRILQAMSIDGVTPKIFGKGKGKDNEPVNALILAFIIAEAGILIGELDVIARVVSMFYLAAYGFINISYYLESWANPDFHPSFKIKRWIGLLGAFASFGVMFKLDMIAMFGAFAVIGGLYFWLQRKQILLQSNDVWQSVWSNVVNKGLQRLDAKKEEKTNWNPNVLLFSGESEQRTKLLEFSKIVSGRTGIVTDFKLVSGNSLSKNKQAYKDNLLEKLAIYGRKVEVDDIYSGIENIASTYGFTGVEPNTVMMNWSRTTQSPDKYVKMTQKLIHLDYNLLYLDYDKKVNFGKQETIDLWWRDSDSNNAEMMLHISRYISQSKEWSKARIRILFVNHNNADNTIVKTKITNLIQQFRIEVEIKIINNGVEQKSFYKIIELQSAKTDLIILGIPNILPEKQATYILNTDELFETVGTTLLVRASNNFNKVDLDFVQHEKLISNEIVSLPPLIKTSNKEIDDVLTQLDEQLKQNTLLLSEPIFKALITNYYQFITNAKNQFEKALHPLKENHSGIRVAHEIQVYLNYLISESLKFKDIKLPEIKHVFSIGLESLIQSRKEIVQNTSKSITVNGKKMYWQSTVDYYLKSKVATCTEESLLNLGFHNYMILKKLTEGINEQVHLFLEKATANEDALYILETNIYILFENLMKDCVLLEKQASNKIDVSIRNSCNEIAELVIKGDYSKLIQSKLEKKKTQVATDNIENFASDWYRNQILIHNLLEADFNLSNSGLSVFIANELIKSKVYRLTITTQQKDIDLFTETVHDIIENLGKESVKYNHRIINKLSDSVSEIRFSELIKNEENRILCISDKTPESLQMMAATSLNNFQNCQNDEIENVEVPLQNIEQQIIQNSYLKPLQDTFIEMEIAFKQNSEELYNASNLVKTILSESVDSDTIDYRKSLSRIKEENEECTIKLKKAEDAFKYNLDMLIHNTFTDLHMRTILENLDSYDNLYKGKTSKFQNWIDTTKNAITTTYELIYELISKRKREVDTLKFNEKYNKYSNDIEKANLFVESLVNFNSIEKDLSFYYKKLFSGSHLGKISPIYKTKEISAISNAINRIENGVSGAIMILGKSFSGKSYFLENIANTFLQKERVHINPPVKQKFDTNDVHLAFQIAFNKSGTAESILAEMNTPLTLIFDDLEKWWVKSDKGNGAINYLTKLIEKFGNKHYFLIACNMYSFDVIRKITTIERQLLANIIIPYASKKELKEIILDRHRTGGVPLWFNNRLLEGKKSDNLFNELHFTAKGNVGIALSQWIKNINKDDEGNLFIQKPQLQSFPNIQNANWKVILYLLTLHQNLSKTQIDKIFNNTLWVFETLEELEKANLVINKSATVYSINGSVKFYIEEWLNKLKILN